MIAHAAMRRACTKKGAISCISVPISPSIRITLIGSTITLMMPLSKLRNSDPALLRELEGDS